MCRIAANPSRSRRVARPPSPPEPRGRAVGPRRGPDRPRRHHRGRRRPPARRLLPAGQRHHLRRDDRPVGAPRADRHRHGRRGPGARGQPGSDRGPGLPVIARRADADGRLRCPVRPHRRAQGGPAEPDRGRGTDRRGRLRGHAGRPGGNRPGRGRAVRGLRASARRRLQPAQAAAPRGVRPPGLPAHPSRRDQRRADRLPRSRRPDHRPPAVRPRDRGRAAVGRQDEPGPQHRRVRRDQQHAAQVGRHLQPGDEQGAAGAPPALVRRRDRQPAPADRVPRRDGLRRRVEGDDLALRGADLHRRHAQHQHDGAAHEGAPAPGGGRARPRDRGLPPAHAVVDDHEGRQPRAGGLGDQPRPQGAGPRAQGPGRRPVPALAPARDAGIEGAAAVRPARVRNRRHPGGPGGRPAGPDPRSRGHDARGPGMARGFGDDRTRPLRSRVVGRTEAGVHGARGQRPDDPGDGEASAAHRVRLAAGRGDGGRRPPGPGTPAPGAGRSGALARRTRRAPGPPRRRRQLPLQPAAALHDGERGQLRGGRRAPQRRHSGRR